MKKKLTNEKKIYNDHDIKAAIRFFINFKAEIKEVKKLEELREPLLLEKYEECICILEEFCFNQLKEGKV